MIIIIHNDNHRFWNPMNRVSAVRRSVWIWYYMWDWTCCSTNCSDLFRSLLLACWFYKCVHNNNSHTNSPNWKLKVFQHSTNSIAISMKRWYSCGFYGINRWLIIILCNQVWNKRCVCFYFLLLFVCVGCIHCGFCTIIWFHLYKS